MQLFMLNCFNGMISYFFQSIFIDLKPKENYYTISLGYPRFFKVICDNLLVLFKGCNCFALLCCFFFICNYYPSLFIKLHFYLHYLILILISPFFLIIFFTNSCKYSYFFIPYLNFLASLPNTVSKICSIHPLVLFSLFFFISFVGFIINAPFSFSNSYRSFNSLSFPLLSVIFFYNISLEKFKQKQARNKS